MAKKKSGKKTQYYKKSFTYKGKRYFGKRCTTEAEAIKSIVELKAQVIANDLIRTTNRTVSSWAIECVEAYKVKQKPVTRATYLQKMQTMILNEIGDMRLSDVTPIKCQEILNKQAGKSKSTINTCCQQLKFIFKMARANRLIPYDPTEDLIKPDGTYTPRRKLTEEEEKVFLKVLPLHHFALYYAFMYYCGCRPSEAAEIRGKDLQINNGQLYLHIRGTKSDAADRYVPVVPDLAKMLPDKYHAEDLLCPNTKGGKMNKKNNLRAWAYLERLMNIEMGCKVYRNQLIEPLPLADDLCAYCLRHTFCTNLQKKGIDLRTAQYLMGHTDVTLTANIYTHSDFEIIGDAAKLMSASVSKTVTRKAVRKRLQRVQPISNTSS